MRDQIKIEREKPTITPKTCSEKLISQCRCKYQRNRQQKEEPRNQEPHAELMQSDYNSCTLSIIFLW